MLRSHHAAEFTTVAVLSNTRPPSRISAHKKGGRSPLNIDSSIPSIDPAKGVGNRDRKVPTFDLPKLKFHLRTLEFQQFPLDPFD